MDSNTITPIVSPCKSHKRIKVQRRPIRAVRSSATNIAEDPVITNNASNPSVTIPIPPIEGTSSKLHAYHHNLSHRNNRIAKARQYVIGNDVILPAWSRQELFTSPNIVKSVGPKSVKRHASHAFAHDKAPPYTKKKHKTMQVLESVDDAHFIPSHGTVENHHFRRYLLEDIMSASPDEPLLILVSPSHPYWGEYVNILRRCPALPQVTHGLITFW